MEVITTIIPIFLIIILGWGARKRGFITPEFLGPANRLVYYLSIPALVFGAISKAPFHKQFDAWVLVLTLGSVLAVYGLAFLLSRLLKMAPERAGAFIQSSGHGNLGYIGLPTAYYYLGDHGLAAAGILCGFVMVLQNLMSIVELQLHDRKGRHQAGSGAGQVVAKLLGNPVIIGAMAGIVVSAFSIPIPGVVRRSIDILAGLAPPMALLLIGASLSLQMVRRQLRPTLGAVTLKLIVLPACGVALFSLLHIGLARYLPALILLCSPTATVAYVMTREMHSDADFAVAAISASTLFSAATFIIWLTVIPLLAG